MYCDAIPAVECLSEQMQISAQAVLATSVRTQQRGA
jgi:hypothetical protein